MRHFLNLSIPLSLVGILAVAAVFVGLALVLSGSGVRHRRGLTDARTLDLDGRNLHSARYGLVGRPDRIVEGNIPEEWKSGRLVYDSHRAPLGAYFVLIEEETGVSPPHGFIVLGDGTRHLIENTRGAEGVGAQHRRRNPRGSRAVG
jgi:CRISPR-associated exonuclease Cas4